ncbi:unnamed protein product, partial [marine sediment metagenome]
MVGSSPFYTWVEWDKQDEVSCPRTQHGSNPQPCEDEANALTVWLPCPHNGALWDIGDLTCCYTQYCVLLALT